MSDSERQDQAVVDQEQLLALAREIAAHQSNFITPTFGEVIQQLYDKLQSMKVTLEDLPLTGEEKERIRVLSEQWLESGSENID
jgi:hypothetical protein